MALLPHNRIRHDKWKVQIHDISFICKLTRMNFPIVLIVFISITHTQTLKLHYNLLKKFFIKDTSILNDQFIMNMILLWYGNITNGQRAKKYSTKVIL